MRKLLILSIISCSTVLFAQDKFEAVKIENENLKIESTDLKKILDINKPILEAEKENTNFRITKVVGNKVEKTISITFLIEAKDDNKELFLSELSIVDLEGNIFQIDFFKSKNWNANLSLKVPIKSIITFKDIDGEPKFIKLFKFQSKTHPESRPLNSLKSTLEFRDLNVSWN